MQFFGDKLINKMKVQRPALLPAAPLPETYQQEKKPGKQLLHSTAAAEMVGFQI